MVFCTETDVVKLEEVEDALQEGAGSHRRPHTPEIPLPKQLGLHGAGTPCPAVGLPLGRAGGEEEDGKGWERPGTVVWAGVSGAVGSGNPGILFLGACSPLRTAAARR